MATFAPGGLKSMPNCCFPVDLAAASRRFTGLPMMAKSRGSFSLTVAGTLWRMAASANSPYVAFCPPGPYSTPLAARTWSGLTFHCAAAAATSMARALAPISRYCVNEWAMLPEPPVICMP